MGCLIGEAPHFFGLIVPTDLSRDLLPPDAWGGNEPRISSRFVNNEPVNVATLCPYGQVAAWQRYEFKGQEAPRVSANPALGIAACSGSGNRPMDA
jgi:hypothetical protein